MVSMKLLMGIKIIILIKHRYLEGRYVKVREVLYIRTISPRYEGSCIVYRPRWSKNKKITVKYPYPTSIKKWEILIVV